MALWRGVCDPALNGDYSLLSLLETYAGRRVKIESRGTLGTWCEVIKTYMNLKILHRLSRTCELPDSLCCLADRFFWPKAENKTRRATPCFGLDRWIIKSSQKWWIRLDNRWNLGGVWLGFHVRKPYADISLHFFAHCFPFFGFDSLGIATVTACLEIFTVVNRMPVW